jgi:protein TonB
MFEESLVESTGLIRSRNRWPTVISIATQAALAAVLISIPMLHPEILSLHAASLAFIAPPPRPAPPPPPPTHVVVATSTTSSAPSAPTAPPMSTVSLIHTIDAPSETPNLNPTTLTMGSNSTTNPFGGTTVGRSSVSVVPATAAKPGNLLHISSGVTTGHLIAPIQPIYPRIAVAAHQEGIVIIQAIISKTGQIESAHVLTGPAMLQSAALEAVRTAHYHPFLLNGDPTEVETTISINFRLGGS